MIKLDLERFTQAWNKVVQQHPQLQGIIEDDAFLILPNVPYYQPHYHDLTAYDDTQRDAVLTKARDSIRTEGVPSNQWPLFDISIYRLANDEYLIHFVFDLVMADGSSLTTLFSQLEAWYLDINRVFPQAELTIRDYLLALEEHKTSKQYINSQTYWLDRIDSLPDAPQLPLSRCHKSRYGFANTQSDYSSKRLVNIARKSVFRNLNAFYCGVDCVLSGSGAVERKRSF